MDFPLVINTSGQGVGLLVRRPLLTLPYVTALTVASALGTVGNLLIVATLCRQAMRHVHKTVGTLFIINLACSDLIVTAVINPFAILGVVRGSTFYDNRFPLCPALAGICIMSCVVSLLSIGCISFNRYLYICKHSSYSKVYTRRNTVLMVLCIWIVGFLFDVPNHVGWSRHNFDGKSHKCLWDRDQGYSYTIFFVVGGVMVPLIIITTCYLRIFIHISQAKQKLARINPSKRSQKAIFKTIRQAKVMFIIFIAFTACWLPYICVLVIDKHDEFPLDVHLYASLVAHIHASINFIIYGIANRTIRNGYSEMVKKLLHPCRKAPGSVQRRNTATDTFLGNNLTEFPSLLAPVALNPKPWYTRKSLPCFTIPEDKSSVVDNQASDEDLKADEVVPYPLTPLQMDEHQDYIIKGGSSSDEVKSTVQTTQVT